jgi:hypothetical protein
LPSRILPPRIMPSSSWRVNQRDAMRSSSVGWDSPGFKAVAGKMVTLSPFYCTTKLAAVVLLPPGVTTVMGPVVAPAGTMAYT